MNVESDKSKRFKIFEALKKKKTILARQIINFIILF